ncbi:MAG: tandem-95 repeat protein, partial [Planctomycetales bacterium]|nr:tandem-95 repeat protein [Planctomycetales bacterium]
QAHTVTSLGEKELAERLQDAGYNLSLGLENVFAFAESGLYGHAGFAIDWGTNPPSGIQSPPGHRDSIMDDRVTEVGVDVLQENDDNSDVGPLLITQDFGRRSGYQAQILGVTWEDGFANGYYEAGEGYGGIEITIEGIDNDFSTTVETMSAGGYQVVVPPGTYQVNARGDFVFALEKSVTNVVMGTQNVKIDFELNSGNNRPLTDAETATVDENSSVAIDVVTGDVDTDGSIVASTVRVATEPSHGTYSINPTTGVITYTPNPGFSGTDTFFYTVEDNDGARSRPRDVTITVNDVNDNPVAVNSSFTVTEGETAQHVVSSFVTDDGTINWNSLEIVSQPAHGELSFNVAARRFTFQADTGFSGVDSFQYRVADTTGAFSNVATVAVTIENSNVAPVATNATLALAEQETKTLGISGNVTDSDGTINWASLEIVQLPASGTASFNSTTRQFTYTANAGSAGSDLFRFRVADNEGAFSNVATVNVTISDVNDAPVAANDIFGTVSGVGRTLDVLANDSDRDGNLNTATVTITSGVSNGSLSVNGRTVTYTAPVSFTGRAIFRYRVTDTGGMSSNEATGTIYVAAPATPWQNPVFRFDAIPDDVITPLDALAIVNNLAIDLANVPSGNLGEFPPPFVDVNGNNVVDPIDALQVVNNLGLSLAPLSARAASSSQAVIVTSPEESQASAIMNTAVPAASSIVSVLPRDVALQALTQRHETTARRDVDARISSLMSISEIGVDTSGADSLRSAPHQRQTYGVRLTHSISAADSTPEDAAPVDSVFGELDDAWSL